MMKNTFRYAIHSILRAMLLTAATFFVCACAGRLPAQDAGTEAAVSAPVEYYHPAAEDDFGTIESVSIDPIHNSQYSLSVPTCINRIGDVWFLVDCYHDQVLWNDAPDAVEMPLTQWYVLADGLAHPHTVAGDGELLLVDDTDHNRVLVFTMKKNGNESSRNEGQPCFTLSQSFSDIGNRPHFSYYDEDTETFYVWSSMSGEMYLFRKGYDESGMPLLKLTGFYAIEELQNLYIRSFTIIGDRVLFVSGISSDGILRKPQILECRLSDFTVTARYDVPEEIAGMAQIMPVEDQYYIMVSTDLYGSQDSAGLLRTDSLQHLSEGIWENIYQEYFVGGGTPYCMSLIDGKWYLTEHRLPEHALWEFEIQNGNIENVRALY